MDLWLFPTGGKSGKDHLCDERADLAQCSSCNVRINHDCPARQSPFLEKYSRTIHRAQWIFNAARSYGSTHVKLWSILVSAFLQIDNDICPLILAIQISLAHSTQIKCRLPHKEIEHRQRGDPDRRIYKPKQNQRIHYFHGLRPQIRCSQRYLKRLNFVFARF